MKKLAPIVIVVLLLIGAYAFLAPKNDSPQTNSSTSAEGSEESSQTTNSSTQSLSRTTVTLPNNAAPGGDSNSGGEESEEQIKPAAEAYTSAEEALAAVLKGSKDYDDSILEQFTLPDPNCSWCAEFYASARDLTTNPNTPQEQRAYLAEILAISGRLENIEALAESIKNAPSNEAADLYAEALELTLGKEDVTTFLGDQMNSTNDNLREASVAAVTNQGTKQAAELLIKNLKERGDPDGYYSIGIGLGEFIPDEEALPVVQDLVRERGPEAGLGVKSLLNAGMPGVRALFDELEHSSNVEGDKALLKGAGDHINIEDDILELANQKIAENRNANTVELARMIKELAQTAEQPTDGDQEELQSLAQ